MEIRCRHGYFEFRETRSGQVSDFVSLYGLNILPKEDYFTFEPLVDVKKYSIVGKPILGIPAIKTYEGHESEVFEANALVYDFNQGIIRNINSVTQVVQIKVAGNYYISNGLILPGSLTESGDRVKDYSARYSRDNQRFTYSEVTYV